MSPDPAAPLNDAVVNIRCKWQSFLYLYVYTDDATASGMWASSHGYIEMKDFLHNNVKNC